MRWHGEDDTARFAARLAALPGLANAFVTLHGDLGAGKTTLVRHLLRALGVQGRIKSPSYAVMESYELAEHGGTGVVSHFDFYRFGDPREWEDAGFREIFTSPGLKLSEWPEKAAGMLPVPDLALHLTMADDDSRHLRMDAHTPLGQSLLAALAPGASA